MDIRKILFTLLISALLIGSAYAASVSDFNVNKTYKNEYSSDYYSVYSKDNQSSGILIFKNVDDDKYDDVVNEDVLDNVVHNDGRKYIVPGGDMKIDVNSDNTANFTDYDHASHGVSEVVKMDGEEFIVVFWANDSSNIDDKDLISQLNDFNKENSVKAIEF